MLLTNLPAEAATALQVSELYLGRWRIEKAFHHITLAYHGEIKPLCDPRAALFCFAIALVGYNAVSIVHATIAIEHSREDAARMSHFAMSREILETTDGLLVALPAALVGDRPDAPPRVRRRTAHDLPQPLLEDISKIRSRPQEATAPKGFTTNATSTSPPRNSWRNAKRPDIESPGLTSPARHDLSWGRADKVAETREPQREITSRDKVGLSREFRDTPARRTANSVQFVRLPFTRSLPCWTSTTNRP